jgi:hypothetical protein
MSFFKNFPTRQFNLNNTGELINVKDIFRHVDVDDLAVDPFISYTYYDIQSGERPDVVSQKLYGTTDFYWTFFIVNDFLKEGIGAWPKSEQELERYITEQYDGTSILQILPEPFNNDLGLRTVTGESYYRNTFLGLDLSHDYLRLRKTGDSNAYALVDRFDPDLFQLHVYKGSNPSEFLNNNRNYVLETYNPYHSQNPMYQLIEQINDAWLEKALTWVQEGYQIVYEFFLLNVATGLSRREYLREFERICLSSEYIGWKVNQVFEIGRDAPISYRNTVTEEPMTAYDVYRGPYTLSSGQIAYGGGGSNISTQTRYEAEVEKNMDRRRIRVVKKSQINAFVEAYKKLIK